MVENSEENVSEQTNHSVAVALITMARYLAGSNPNFRPYLGAALEHAEASKLAEADLAMLRMLIGATDS